MEEYGKSPEFPIILSSVGSSIHYLNGLVTLDGANILYHRVKSFGRESKIIDHYELIDGHGNYDDIYIDIYNEIDRFVPPSGYMFTHSFADDIYTIDEMECSDEKMLQYYLFESFGVNFFIDSFPYSLIEKMIDDFQIIGKKDKIFKTFKNRVKAEL